MPPPDLSIVVLNYRTPGLTAEAVRGALDAAEEAGIRAGAVIVDNSGPETGEALEVELGGRARILLNERNVGFAAGCNQGAAGAEGRHLLFLNSDAEVGAACLEAGVSFLDDRRDVALWAPALRWPDGAFQPAAGRFPTLPSLAAEYLLARPAHLYLDSGRWEGPTEVDYLSGAVLLARRTAFEEVGGFDERFFFTMEDVDLCLRLRERGWGVVLDPTASAGHLHGASGEAAPWGEDPHLHEARIAYFRKHRSSAAAAAAEGLVRTGRTLRRWLRPLRGR